MGKGGSQKSSMGVPKKKCSMGVLNIGGPVIRWFRVLISSPKLKVLTLSIEDGYFAWIDHSIKEQLSNSFVF